MAREKNKCKCGRLKLKTSKHCRICNLFTKPYLHKEKYTRKYRHHLDTDKNNNAKSNELYLSLAKHQSLHRRAYDYIAKVLGIKELKKYLKWFKKNYGGI